MSEEEQKKDNFWLIVGTVMFVILVGIGFVKQSENEKFEPIKQQLIEENTQMNIRVIKQDY